ncbi:acyl carrier protein [Streptomyces sp. ADMS]|uniref:acyl carrier protein n=1 Tax=Streptomyces sp. ADMS TaxID=3071415 RepID=UPI00296E3C16|nr:acyl carrier protein [Streptomyces sp. ADMS]MDW4909128.1 acyl carrier protein [Streptomyces sp. ADMS]
MSESEEDGMRTAEILREVARAFEIPEVGVGDSFAKLGANSVGLLRLMSAIQEKFDVIIDLVDIFQVKNVAELVTLVDEVLARKKER